MSSDFEAEEDMYPQLKRWLLEQGCDTAYHVNEARFRFTPADKSYITDVVGRDYDEDGNPFYIGIEAKNEVKDSQKILNQCISSLAFCRKAYLAVPKKLFDYVDDVVKDRIRNRAGQENVGVLLVLKSRVEEIVPAPSQRFIHRIYNRVGDFFEEQQEEPPYYEEKGLWSSEQATEFSEDFISYAPRTFTGTQEDIWSEADEEDDIRIIHIPHLFRDEIYSEIQIHPRRISVDMIYDADASEIMSALLNTYECDQFDQFYSVYNRRVRAWEKLGMKQPPYLEIDIPKRKLLVRLGELEDDTTIFNLGALLKNMYLTPWGFDAKAAAEDDDACIKIHGEFERSSWQKAISKDAGSIFELLYSLLEQASLFLSRMIEDEE